MRFLGDFLRSHRSNHRTTPDDDENARMASLLEMSRPAPAPSDDGTATSADAPRRDGTSSPADISSPDSRSEAPAPAIPELPGGQPTASESFLLDIELANPG